MSTPLLFGMPTLIENTSLEENAALCSKLALDFVEINMNMPDFQIEKLNATIINALKEKYKIFFTIHLDENLNIADFNEKISNAYTETVLQTIDFAKEIEAPILNMHLNHGVYFTLPDKKVYLFEKYFDSYISNFRKFAALCENRIGDSNIKICIENTDGFKDFEKQAIDELLKSPAFALTWDIGHSISTDEIDEEFLLSHKKYLSHFHIHDGTKKSDGAKSHLELGAGKIELEKWLAVAKECNARCVIETKTIESLRKSVDWLKKNLYLNYLEKSNALQNLRNL